MEREHCDLDTGDHPLGSDVASCSTCTFLHVHLPSRFFQSGAVVEVDPNQDGTGVYTLVPTQSESTFLGIPVA